MNFINIPNTISFNEISEINSLSPQTFKKFDIKNENTKTLRELIIEKDKGKEVGSFAYITKSNKFFIKTKALQKSSFLPIFEDGNQITPILPSSFIDYDLKQGDVLISIDSKFDTVILDKDLENCMISNGLIRVEFDDSEKYYIFAFMKSDFFNQQIENVPKGATITHIKDHYLDFKIPFPENEEIIKFIEVLVKCILKKEEEIKIKHEKILNFIDEELKLNQYENSQLKLNTSFKDILELDRIDAAPFSMHYKKYVHLISNYKFGAETLEQLGFKILRGPNLAEKFIGKKILSDDYKKNFYKRILPKNITKYGTISSLDYMGNKNQLNTLQKGDILFGAEGFKKGRSILIREDDSTLITNYHGVILRHEKSEMVSSIFIKCLLDYYRSKGLIDIWGTGGNGGSISPTYLKKLVFPIFSVSNQNKISEYYYKYIKYDIGKINIENFEDYDNYITKKSGILQLDLQIKKMKETINQILYKIINDENVNLNLKFLENINEESI